MTLSEITRFLGGTLDGDGTTEITRVAKIEEASRGDITFVSNPKYRRFISSTGASAIIITHDEILAGIGERSPSLNFIRVKDPYLAFLRIVDLLTPPPAVPLRGVHPAAVTAPSAVIHPDAAVGPNAVIGERCTIGAGTILHPCAVLGDNVTVGEGSVIHANVTVREGCRIGNRVIIHAGTVIGSDGFGFAPRDDGSYEKIPQRGIVVIEDDVEVGANCAIDRATIGETRIKKGAKLDNLIQIAHNVVIGEHTVIAAQTGISGSTKLGRQCAVGGQVGFVGHIEIAERTTIGAKSGIPKSITKPGTTYFGYPAHELRRQLRIEAVISQLPELLTQIQELQHRLTELERGTGGASPPIS